VTYSETLSYLFEQLPMYHRIGAAAYKANLDNTIALCEMLNHPEKEFKSIHIAGTNGKGSTSHMLAAVFQQAGYKTALYTSPHLKDFRERIRINGEMISEEYVTDFVGKHRRKFEKIKLSFFEWTVGLAFDYYANKKVDVAIIETGLGGRLDSTNIITPLISVITNISYDHMSLLGNSIEKIAEEKAGIIKKTIPVVVGERDNSTEQIFKQKAEEMESPLVFASDNFETIQLSENDFGQVITITKNRNTFLKEVQIDLAGNYQLKNVCTVLQTLEVLKNDFPEITSDNIQVALSAVKKLTGLMGRWQVLSKKPLVICDVAHNEAGIKMIRAQLEKLSFDKLHFVLGIVSDKDITAVLNQLPKNAFYYFCKPDLPRGLDVETLKKHAHDFGLSGNSFPSVRVAFDAAKEKAGINDVVFVGGSTFVVAEII
jgi:dihydrofolate synthase / folylpolyglutamate synthase